MQLHSETKRYVPLKNGQWCDIIRLERGDIMEYTIKHNELGADDFIRLFDSAGWGKPDRGLVERSLKNSYVTFSVHDGEKVVAMARLIGDGGMAFFLKDLIVAPEHQGQGIGKALLEHIEEYIRGELEEG